MFKKKPIRTAAAAALLAFTVWSYVSIDSEDWILTSERIPEAFSGTRITLLTDLHGSYPWLQDSCLLEAVRASRPDFIAISGDLYHESTDLHKLDGLLTALSELAPTFFVTGNHEWGRDDTEELLQNIEAHGITVLRNDYRLLERDGQQLVLAGAEDPMAYADMEQPEQLVARIRQEVSGDPYLVMLSHRNNKLYQWAALQADLVLAGHGHGGVIRLPFVGGLLGVDREFFPDDEEGLYASGRTTLAVSRGMAGLRLWNRPHLPTLVLQNRAVQP